MSPSPRSKRSNVAPPMPSERRLLRPRIVIAWGWVLGWALIIWLAGGDSFSARSTSPGLLEWLRWLFADLDLATRYRIVIGLRKSAHFVEYAILAMLTFRAALISSGRHRLTSAAWIALFIVATLASADEARQAFSTSRTGSPFDVLIDIAGGAVAVIGTVLILRRLRRTDPASAATSTTAAAAESA